MEPVQLKFTNNFYSYITSLILSEGQENNTNYVNGQSSNSRYVTILGSITDTQGRSTGSGTQGRNLTYIGSTSSFYVSVSSFAMSNVNNIVVGNSTQTLTSESYNLGNVLNNISIQKSFVHYLENNEGNLDININVKNNNAEAITIKEIGLTFKVSSDINGGYTDTPVLFAYSNLNQDQYLEINSGDTKTLTIRLSMPVLAN